MASAPEYLTGDKQSVRNFLDRFDVSFCRLAGFCSPAFALALHEETSVIDRNCSISGNCPFDAYFVDCFHAVRC